MSKSAQIDQYILKSAEFAQPILEHLRLIIHTACPEVEETLKWSFPNFVYKGKILCSMAAFKKHCSFGFWNSSNIEDNKQLLEKVGRTAMGNLGRIESLDQIPDAEDLLELIVSAAKQIDEGKGSIPKKNSDKGELKVPEILLSALKKHTEAGKHFAEFSTSQKREYADWINDAKTEATALKRLETAIEWIAEGKTRNWKYMKK